MKTIFFLIVLLGFVNLNVVAQSKSLLTLSTKSSKLSNIEKKKDVKEEKTTEKDSLIIKDFYIGAGLNFNYSNTFKVSGGYFSVNTSVPNFITKLHTIDFWLAMGNTLSADSSNTLNETTRKNDLVVKNFDNQNIYLSATVRHDIPFISNMYFIFPNIEIRNVNSSVRDYKILSRIESPNVVKFDTINNSFTESSFKHFVGFGVGTQLATKIMFLKVNIMFGWNLSKGMDNIIRFNLKTLGGFNIGGEVRNALTVDGRNGEQKNEILTYISKDIEIDFINNLLGLKK